MDREIQRRGEEDFGQVGPGNLKEKVYSGASSMSDYCRKLWIKGNDWEMQKQEAEKDWDREKAEVKTQAQLRGPIDLRLFQSNRFKFAKSAGN